MVELTKQILFASDLSVNMKKVFEQAAALAVCRNANIVVLHVMEETPRSEQKIRMAFGEQLYRDIKSEHKEGARNILIGKNVDALRIRNAIAGFFKDSGRDLGDEGIDGDSPIKKILVSESMSIADEIVATAEQEDCGMIVMGCKQQGLIAEAMGDHIVRKVLRRSSVPVFVVPFSDK